jgi:hypothetical protein
MNAIKAKGSVQEDLLSVDSVVFFRAASAFFGFQDELLSSGFDVLRLLSRGMPRNYIAHLHCRARFNMRPFASISLANRQSYCR